MPNCLTIKVLGNEGDAKKITGRKVFEAHFFKGFTELIAYFSSQIVGLKKIIKKWDFKSALVYINIVRLGIKTVLIEKVKIRTPFSCFNADLKNIIITNGFQRAKSRNV